MFGVRHNAHSVRKIYLSKDRTQAFGTDFNQNLYFRIDNFALVKMVNCAHTHTTNSQTTEPSKRVNEQMNEQE